MNNRNDDAEEPELHNVSHLTSPQTSQIRPERKEKPPVRRKRASFASMSNLMNKLVVKLGLDQRLKEHALMNLWPTLVGDSFAAKSRCLFIDNERKLVVSVQDASVGQELSLHRRDLMRKIQAAASGLGVKIEGLRFDMKHFYQGQAEAFLTAPLENPLPKASLADLQSVILTEDEIAQIESMRRGPSNPSEVKGYELSSRLNLNDRIATIFEHELRLKSWQIANGYPLCGMCREPAQHLHGAEKLCAHCFYKSISPRSI